MRNPTSPRSSRFSKEWLRRLDHAAAELNVLLVVVAIGLAALDVTFAFSERIIDRLPQVVRRCRKGSSSAKPEQRAARRGMMSNHFRDRSCRARDRRGLDIPCPNRGPSAAPAGMPPPRRD